MDWLGDLKKNILVRKWNGFKLSSPNAAVKGRHAGERCFILCNGPSVRKQDLTVLAGETVISVSSGYHHPDYGVIKPRYHCVPQITYGLMTEQDVIKWFGEMHERLGEAELFLSSNEAALVQSRRLFSGRTVRYLFLSGSTDKRRGLTPVDISKTTPGVQSVSIMCLMIAIYMGFSDIYLIGTDHDAFMNGEYKYFYEPTVLKGKDMSADVNGKTLTSRYEDFHTMASLWRQYRLMRRIGETHGIRIWNATAGGELDEFPRVRLEEAAGRPPRA